MAEWATLFKFALIQGSFHKKLQNGIILFIFIILKIQNIGFVCNLIGHMWCNFYKDDAITVTSCLCRTQLVSAVFFTHSFPTCQMCLLNTIVSYE